MKYIKISDVVEAAGMGRHHAARTLRDFDPNINIAKVMLPSLNGGKRLTFAISEKDANKFTKSRGQGIVKIRRKIKPPSSHEQLAKEYEKKGFTVFRLFRGGADLLVTNLPRKELEKLKDKLFFREAKSSNSGSGLSKSQDEERRKMRESGLDCEVDWRP